MVAVVELVPDDVDGDDVQAANVIAARAMVNHNRRGFRPCAVESFAANRTPHNIKWASPSPH